MVSKIYGTMTIAAVCFLAGGDAMAQQRRQFVPIYRAAPNIIPRMSNSTPQYVQMPQRRIYTRPAFQGPSAPYNGPNYQVAKQRWQAGADYARGLAVRSFMGDVNKQAQVGADYRSAFKPGVGTGYSAYVKGAGAIPGYAAGVGTKLVGRSWIDIGRAGDAYLELNRRGGISWGR
jgi:hypothetical protein